MMLQSLKIILLAAIIILFQNKAKAQNTEQWKIHRNGISSFTVIQNIRNTLPGEFKFPVGKANISEIIKLFQEMKTLDLPISYINECCYDKSEVITQELARRNLPTLRVFVERKLGFGPFVNKWLEKFVWFEHTAPALLDEQNQIWIFDTSIADQPLLLQNWLSLFAKFNHEAKISLGHQYVYSIEDLDDEFAVSFRPNVQEAVVGSLKGCSHVQNLKNERGNLGQGKSGCKPLQQTLSHTMKNKVSDFWAQKLAGLDLANELLSNLKSRTKLSAPIVHIWDEKINFSNSSIERPNHAASVYSFFQEGPQAASLVARMGLNSDVIYNTEDFTQAAKELPNSNVSQLINLSAGWKLYTDRIHQAFITAFNKNAVIVKAAGNKMITGSQEREYQPDDSRFIRVGSVGPEGLINDFSAIRSDFIIYAPSDLFLTARAGAKKEFTPFAQTSGATPLVTGALANVLAIRPELKAHDLKKLLWDSSLKMKSPDGKIVYHNLNAYAMVVYSLPNYLKEAEINKVQKEAFISKLNLKRFFPKCFPQEVLPNKPLPLSSCENLESNLNSIRKDFLLVPSLESASALSCVYGSLGYLREADYYLNWKFSESGKLSQKIANQNLPNQVLLRNVQLLSKQDAIRAVGELGKTEQSVDQMAAIALRTDLYQHELWNIYQSIPRSKDKVRMLESLISIREAVHFLYPRAARTPDLEVKMAILDVLYNTENREIKKYFLTNFNHISEPRIWVKVANFIEHYEPDVRTMVIDMLMGKPIEVAQGILLEKLSYYTQLERKHLLTAAARSQFKLIRQKAEELRKSSFYDQTQDVSGHGL